MIALSTVIPTRNRPEFLDRCLAALGTEIAGRPDAQTIVVDDASDDAGASRNAELCALAGVDYIRLGSNQGPAVARNAGIARAAGDWIAFVDDDVCVQPGWGAAVRSALAGLTDGDVIGVEGRIEPSGHGVWDREVQNLSGGLYLSSHIVYRADLLRRVGGFDAHFAREGPFCEDHELALRMLQWGTIAFEPRLVAVHLPRRVRLARHLLDSPRRIRQLLCAERYFCLKHPAHYHRFRHARTFWGTWAAIALKNVVTTLRRRTLAQLARHPVQTVVLIATGLIEQAAAWMALPAVLRRGRIPDGLDPERTRAWWQLPRAVNAGDFALRRKPVRAALFPLLRRPVYDAAPLLQRLNSRTSTRLYLRVDDVFFSRPDAVRLLCAVCAGHGAPFLAAVTGDDLGGPGAGELRHVIESSGGEVGLHGFAHRGRYGPYDSEVLQMRFPDLEARARDILDTAGTGGRPPCAFVPPFNAVAWDQVLFLTRFFPVICGGPESVRFTGGLWGPVAVGGRSWYFPSVYPHYGTAAEMLRRRSVMHDTPGVACITVHCPHEARDEFSSLALLLDVIAPRIRPWTDFLPQSGAGP